MEIYQISDKPSAPDSLIAGLSKKASRNGSKPIDVGIAPPIDGGVGPPVELANLDPGSAPTVETATGTRAGDETHMVRFFRMDELAGLTGDDRYHALKQTMEMLAKVMPAEGHSSTITLSASQKTQIREVRDRLDLLLGQNNFISKELIEGTGSDEEFKVFSHPYLEGSPPPPPPPKWESLCSPTTISLPLSIGFPLITRREFRLHGRPPTRRGCVESMPLDFTLRNWAPMSPKVLRSSSSLTLPFGCRANCSCSPITKNDSFNDFPRIAPSPSRRVTRFYPKSSMPTLDWFSAYSKHFSFRITSWRRSGICSMHRAWERTITIESSEMLLGALGPGLLRFSSAHPPIRRSPLFPAELVGFRIIPFQELKKALAEVEAKMDGSNQRLFSEALMASASGPIPDAEELDEKNASSLLRTLYLLRRYGLHPVCEAGGFPRCGQRPRPREFPRQNEK